MWVVMGEGGGECVGRVMGGRCVDSDGRGGGRCVV